MKRILKEIKSEFCARKTAALILIIAGIVFTLLQADNFNITMSYFNNEKVEPPTKNEKEIYTDDQQKLDAVKDDKLKYSLHMPSTKSENMKGSAVITQTFKAEDPYLKRVNLIFNCPNSYDAKGNVTVSVLNGKGKEICHSKLKSTLVQHQSLTYFDFTDDSSKMNEDRIIQQKVNTYKREGIKVKKGDTYTLKVSSNNVKAKGAFSVYLCDQDYSDDTVYTCNGEKSGNRLLGAVAFIHFDRAVTVVFIAGYILAALLVLIPLGYFSEMLSRRRKKEISLNVLISRIMFVLTPFASYFIIEKSIGFKTSDIVFDMATFP